MADNQPEKPLIMVDPHWFEGVPYPGVFSQKTLESLKHTQVYDDDIYVAAYPKSGISYLFLFIFIYLLTFVLYTITIQSTVYKLASTG